MSEYTFKLPDLGEGMAEAEIVAWHAAVGDMIEEDQLLVDVMTDKATVEITAPVSGKLLARTREAGEMAPIGAALAVFLVGGTAEEIDTETPGAPTVVADAPLPGEPEADAETTAAPSIEPSSDTALAPPPLAGGDRDQGATLSAAASNPFTAARPPSPNLLQRGEEASGQTLLQSIVLAAPAVRQRAKALGIALETVQGSGPEGRITHADLDRLGTSGQARDNAKPVPPADQKGGEDGQQIKVAGLRRRIAEKMQEAVRRIPHFSYIEEIDVTDIEILRKHLNSIKAEHQGHLTFLPLFIRALIRALPEFPQLNATFDDEAGIIHRSSAVHLGIAAQTPSGLMVPVIRHAERLDIWQTGAEIARLSTAARQGKANRDELSGSTITVTSLGALGGIATTPIINHPEVAIIGPNKITDRPVIRDGQIAIRKMMNLSISCDHRVVDGYDAAQFAQRLKGLIEYPATIFMG